MTDPKKNPNKQRRSFFWRRMPLHLPEPAKPMNGFEESQRESRPWSRPTLLKAAVVGLGVLAILPPRANGQFGIDTAAILAAISKMQSLMTTYIAAPLKTINQYEQSVAKYEQEVMYPLAAINQAKTSVMQFEGQFNQINSLFHVNVSSATLPQSQNLESLLLSRNAANVPTVSGQFQNVYGVVMSQNAASPQMRTMTDMTDAQALNQLFTPTGWTRTYEVSTVSAVTRMKKDKLIQTGKVLVTCTLTITGLGCHAGSGEDWADESNAMTTAEAQAFKRAASCYGLGRYLYNLAEMWVPLNEHRQPFEFPSLPQWALPKTGAPVKSHPASGPHPATVQRGPIDQRITGKIEGFRRILGDPIYGEILWRVARTQKANAIPNAQLQTNVAEAMERAARGIRKAHSLAESIGDIRGGRSVEN